MTRPIRALILSGGGARGAYEAGVVGALAEHMRFDVVCGTSIGAVNGFAVAQGLAPKLGDIWREAAESNVVAYRHEVAALMNLWREIHSAVAGGKPFQRFRDALAAFEGLPGLRELPHLHNLLGFLDSAQMRAVVARHARTRDLESALLVAATNLTSVQGTVFAWFPKEYADRARADAVLARGDVEPITDENYVDAICASAAIPGAFEPVSIDCKDGRRHAFVDGAFTNNTPLEPAIDAGATEIVAISLRPVVSASAERQVRHLRDVITLALEASTVRMLQLDRKVLELTNQRVANDDAPDRRHIVLREVGPQADLEVEPLDFTQPGKIAALIAQGREDGERALSEAFAS